MSDIIISDRKIRKLRRKKLIRSIKYLKKLIRDSSYNGRRSVCVVLQYGFLDLDLRVASRFLCVKDDRFKMSEDTFFIEW